MLFVVVVPAIAVQTSHAEEVLHRFEAPDALCALCHHELMRDLDPGLVAPSFFPMGLSDEMDREASLSVDKASDPTDQSFLLIVRIRRIVTARLANTAKCLFGERVPRNTRIFQHIARFY